MKQLKTHNQQAQIASYGQPLNTRVHIGGAVALHHDWHDIMTTVYCMGKEFMR